MKNVRFALAIDGNGQFADSYFSMSDYFHFYEYREDTEELRFIAKVANHGLVVVEEQKYSTLIEFLNQNQIDLLVARNYSTKPKMQCQYFVPIIIDKKLQIEEICDLLKNQIRWLADELSLNKKENMVFNMTNGIYKYRSVDEN